MDWSEGFGLGHTLLQADHRNGRIAQRIQSTPDYAAAAAAVAAAAVATAVAAETTADAVAEPEAADATVTAEADAAAAAWNHPAQDSEADNEIQVLPVAEWEEHCDQAAAAEGNLRVQNSEGHYRPLADQDVEHALRRMRHLLSVAGWGDRVFVECRSVGSHFGGLNLSVA